MTRRVRLSCLVIEARLYVLRLNDFSSKAGYGGKTIAKSLMLSHEAFALFDAWQFPTLAWGDPTLPSALRRFTSEFGMGSGGTTALVPPGKFCCHAAYRRTTNLVSAENHLSSPKPLRRGKVKPHGSLVPVSSTHRCAYTPGLSTSSSSTFLQET